MRIAFFGSSLVSAYWNGAATYYRGLTKALAACGQRVAFYEPDALERQSHRDIAEPHWCDVHVYQPNEMAMQEALKKAAGWADVLVKCSGVGVLDHELEKAVLDHRDKVNSVIFWDVDAPATLESIKNAADDPMRNLIPKYDAVLTYGGGNRVVAAYAQLGARLCVPIYNAIDPDTHHPVQPLAKWRSSLTFLGNRLPDREARVEEFFLGAAKMLPEEVFLLGGSGWEDKQLPGNVGRLGHVYTRDHNVLNCSAKAVLNVNRESMARNGASPPTRIFEAAGAGACIISDRWEGIETFLEPGREILLADDGAEVASLLRRLDGRDARKTGAAARRRVLADHTYAHRAAEVVALLQGRQTLRKAG